MSRGPAGTRLVRQLAPLVSLRAGLRWFSACRSRSFLERAWRAESAGTRLARYLAPLFSLRAGLRCVRLLHDSVSWWLVRRSRAALVSAAHFLSAAQSPARANSTGIRLLSSVPHSWSSSFDCPASQVKKNQAHLPRREPLSWFCVSDLLLLKRRELLRAVTLDDSTPQCRISELRVWSYETFIVSASSSSG